MTKINQYLPILYGVNPKISFELNLKGDKCPQVWPNTSQRAETGTSRGNNREMCTIRTGFLDLY